MTPPIQRETFAVGDRVADKRTGPHVKAGRGTVIAVYADCVRVRWDGTDHAGIRDTAFLRREAPDA